MDDYKQKFSHNGYSGYLHEAIQVVHVLMGMVDDHLVSAPATKFGDMEKSVEKIQEGLMELYQEYSHIDTLNDLLMWLDDGRSLEDLLKLPAEERKSLLDKYFTHLIDEKNRGTHGR